LRPPLITPLLSEPRSSGRETNVIHIAPEGVSQARWNAYLRQKADLIEEDIRDLLDERRYAHKAERDDIDERIARNEALLSQMCY